MRDEILRPDLSAAADAAGAEMGLLGEERRRVRMTRVPGQALVLMNLCGGDAVPIEIHFAEAGAGGATVLDFLLPDSIFVEHKETVDSVQALFRLPLPVATADD